MGPEGDVIGGGGVQILRGLGVDRSRNLYMEGRRRGETGLACGTKFRGHSTTKVIYGGFKTKVVLKKKTGPTSGKLPKL